MDDFDTEELKVRAFIGEGVTLIVFRGITWDKVSSDAAVRHALTRQIREAIAELRRGA